MNRFDADRRRKIYEVIVAVKLMSILVGGIAILSHFNISKEDWLNSGAPAMVCLFVFALIYQIWIHFIQRTKVIEQITVREILELALLIIMNTGIVIYTGGHVSQYKAMFLFSIIIATIQAGEKWGMISAGASSLSIAIIDLLTYPKGQVNPFFQSDLILISIFFLASWLIGNYIRTETFYRNILSNMANMDELTGLYNHRHFQEYLDIQMERAKAIEEPVSLLFGDLDYFKYYNDIYGHLQGDKILMEVSRIIEETVEARGTVARYGGEEFAVILPGCTEEKAYVIAEEIRKAIEQFPFEGEESLPGNGLTISIGVSTFPDKAQSKAELISSADEALYKAKFISKNKVEIYFSVLDELKDELNTEQMDSLSSIKTLISVINAKDRYTYGHTERVVQYCQLIGEALQLSPIDIKTLQYGAYLHDIGKIEIPKEILNKKEKLGEEEWNILKQHPVDGADIVRPVTSLHQAIPLILHHHERLDGKGYPDGLPAEEIPLLVRILTVADSFDAMTTPRPYKGKKNLHEAIDELRRCKGSQFDEKVVEVFVKLIQKKNLTSEIFPIF